MLDFLFGKRKDKTATDWKNLDGKQKVAITRKMIRALAGGPRYRVVSGTDQWQRARGMPEWRDEDEILNIYGRGKMLDLARNATRNSSTFSGLLKQLDLNVVGVKGGKATFNFDGAEEIKDRFSEWTRSCEFYDGLSFNSLLKLTLKTYLLGGDLVLMMDDALIEDSGRLLVFEPDEINSTTDEAIKSRFGDDAKQSLGRVYNRNGRFIGAVVSRSQRGVETFDPDKCYFLRRDPDASILDSFWTMPRNVFRVAQGRGIPSMSTSLATILDLEDLQSFELAAAKKNAQTIAQVLQTASNSTEEAEIPSAFEDGTDFADMTDDEIRAAVQEERRANTQTITLDQIRAAGVAYNVMPENFKMELLDTKHPNSNTPEFIDWLASRASAPWGLSRAFATLKVDGDSFRGEQILTWPAYIEAQRFLEREVCDWALNRWAIWARKRGIIKKDLPEGWLRSVAWSWPQMDEVDENSHQDAVEKKLRNMLGSYREELGPDWRDKLLEIRDEIEWFKTNDLPHPAYAMISGGERTGADTESGN